MEPVLKRLLTEVHKIIRLYLTIPVTTATAERTFSAIRRIKTYLRVTMSQPRLNQCMITHVHRTETDNVNLGEIAKDFISRNERRCNFFGKLLS